MTQLHLYNFTLQKSSGVTHSICGNFINPDEPDIVVAKGHLIEILKLDSSGRLATVLSTELFGVIRSMTISRLTGFSKDYIIIGSDSGKITILEYSKEQNALVKVHEETFGRSGVRRIVPGQYLASDPAGRAVMIAAVEKQKFVYILNRDNEARLTISSPLEAHRSSIIVYDIVGLDVNYLNPTFIAIEMDYSKADLDPTGKAVETSEKFLTWYELELSLNHVVRKQSIPTDRSAHRLISVPADKNNPGGILVCAKNVIYYYDQPSNEKLLSVKLPQRVGKVAMNEKGQPDPQTLIVAHTVLKMSKGVFFFVQTEYGDLFRVWLGVVDKKVQAIYATYFDTIPVATSLAVIPQSGYMYVATETGNQCVYYFLNIPPFENTPSESVFEPHELTYLRLSDEIPCLTPILDLKIDHFDGQETRQLMALCGSGPRSTCRILRHGIAVVEAAQVSLQQAATSIWVLRRSKSAVYDQYIVVSFNESTLVMGVGDIVEEIQSNDPLYPFFLQTAATLNIGCLHDDSLVQITMNQIRHYRNGQHVLWNVPDGHKIFHTAMNDRQVVIALDRGEVHYFELDHVNRLKEIQRMSTNREITALALQPVPPNRQRGRFLAVADGEKNVRVYSLDSTTDCLQHLATQVLPARASSLAFISLNPNELLLNIGISNGLFMRCVVDPLTGQLSSPRQKYLGTKMVRLFPITVENKKQALLALSSRSWLLHSYQTSIRILPLTCFPLDYASPFHSELCPDSIVCSTSEKLRILTIERLGDVFNQTEIPLRYTPRQSTIHPVTKHVLIVESDHNAYSESERQKLNERPLKVDPESEDYFRARLVSADIMYGVPQPGPGKWGSCIRVLDVRSNQTVDCLEFENNEAAVSICTCRFRDRSEYYICVGVVKDLILQPKRVCSEAYINVYILENNKRLLLLHSKKVENIPNALVCIKNRLFAGVGNTLKVFDLGKKAVQLLRKIECSSFPTHIVTISQYGDRLLYVGDLQESVHYVRYSTSELVIIADDVTPRWITSVEALDYNTIACSDKFGNIAILRLRDKDAKAESDPNRPVKLQGYLQGAPYKLELVCHFYVGETVTRLAKAQLTPGGSEFLIYVTVTGAIGALLPIISREDMDFLSHMEMCMRADNPPLCGNDHLAYRSRYFPVKNVIDGDLCEQYFTLSEEKQMSMSLKLERDVLYISRKIEDMRDQI